LDQSSTNLEHLKGYGIVATHLSGGRYFICGGQAEFLESNIKKNNQIAENSPTFEYLGREGGQ